MTLNDLDLNKLHAFAVVVESGGITPAADRLGRTRSAVSQSISALESSLGVKLFDRVGKRLVLTRGGQILHRRFGEVQGNLQRAIDELTDEAAEATGLVRVGMFLGFPRPRFAEFVKQFTTRHPKAGVRVVYAPQEDLNERLVDNRLDFAFSFQPRSQPRPALASTRLFEQELILVSSRRFFRRGFSRAELGTAPIVDYYQSDPLIDRWLAHHFGENRPERHVKIWAATTDLVLDLVLNGTGIGVLPDSLAAPYVRRGRLVALTPRKPELSDAIWLIEPRGAYRDATLQAFRAAVIADLA